MHVFALKNKKSCNPIFCDLSISAIRYTSDFTKNLISHDSFGIKSFLQCMSNAKMNCERNRLISVHIHMCYLCFTWCNYNMFDVRAFSSLDIKRKSADTCLCSKKLRRWIRWILTGSKILSFLSCYYCIILVLNIIKTLFQIKHIMDITYNMK